jgi:signal transduction histidine kinase
MTVNLFSSKHDKSTGKTDISLPESEMLELVDVLQITMQNVSKLIKIDGSSIALFDSEHEKLVTLATFQKESCISLHTQLQENHDVASWVAELRKALIINDVSHDVRLKHMKTELTGSVIFAPLIDRDNFIGILTASRTEIEAFSLHDIHALTIFSEQAALAIISAFQAELARKDAAHMKTHFLSMVTHELRSPLNSINGYLDLMLDGMAGVLNQQQREFVQRARAGSEHLYALIEDLLLISRADAGQLRLNLDLISIPEIVANAIEELELIAIDNEVALLVEIPSDLPQVTADAVRIQHVFRNLINNALRFTLPGGNVSISAHVDNDSIDANQEQQQITLHIRDTGYGIAPEYHEQIFERFYQIPNVNAIRVGGQGLGLTIVKLIVELHGGQISVESVPGIGSTFKLILPLSPVN